MVYYAFYTKDGELNVWVAKETAVLEKTVLVKTDSIKHLVGNCLGSRFYPDASGEFSYIGRESASNTKDEAINRAREDVLNEINLTNKAIADSEHEIKLHNDWICKYNTELSKLEKIRKSWSNE